jgi:hypothetical protein
MSYGEDIVVVVFVFDPRMVSLIFICLHLTVYQVISV